MSIGINNIGNRTTRRFGAQIAAKLFQNKILMDKKLKIENYAKDLNLMVIYGWDVISAEELDDNYIFQLSFRTDPKARVYITLSRELQRGDDPENNDLMYQCYIHDDKGEWSERTWFYGKDLTYKNFWECVEDIIEKYEPSLPF